MTKFRKNMKNQYVKKYYKILKEMFLNLDYMEGKFLRDFKSSLIEYTITHQECTYDELISHFGTPQEVFCEYLGNQDTDFILSCINKKHFRKWFKAGIIITCIFCALIWISFYYSAYKKSVDAVIDKEVLYIEVTREEKYNEKQ